MSTQPVPSTLRPTTTDAPIPEGIAWQIVAMCLHHNGQLHARTKELRADQSARTLADGFGPGVTDPDLLWDWSHVRDSSPSAIQAMAEHLCSRFEGAGALHQIVARL